MADQHQEHQDLMVQESGTAPLVYSPGVLSSLRDLGAISFRRRRLMILSFLGVFVGAVLVAMLDGSTYEAEMKILVRHRRVDPVVTSASVQDSASAAQAVAQTAVVEEEINSEVELIQSSDLLEQVVLGCGLDKPKPHFWSSWIPSDPALRTPKAVRKLKNDLKVNAVRKSDLVQVTYASKDPQLAARVLNTLGSLYLEKHMEVNRWPGQFDFFDQQAQKYRKQLADTEARLVAFARDKGTVAAQPERDIQLQKVNELEVMQAQNLAAIASQRQRIQALETQLASTPPRLSTQMKTGDNGILLETLKATLLNLQLKRTELLAKFQPDYRPVQDVEAQIAQAQASIASAEKAPIREDTTDQNPTYLWLAGELAKAKAELPTLKASAEATAKTIQDYRRKLLGLDQKGIEQQDLLRDAKSEEANYLLYLNKREEAHISEALDNKRIANVVIAEAATVPALPVYSAWMLVLLGGILASMVSIGSALVAERLDAPFRTPDDVRESLNIPVFAAIPAVPGDDRILEN